MSPGDLVGLRVDLGTGRLEFTLNGHRLGVAFYDVRGPVSPAVALLKGQRVTIVTGSREQPQLEEVFD